MWVMFARRSTIIGTNGPDTLFGTGFDDAMSALDGDDFVNAGAGNDSVSGGLGNDDLRGLDGNDTLSFHPPQLDERRTRRRCPTGASRPTIRPCVNAGKPSLPLPNPR